MKAGARFRATGLRPWFLVGNALVGVAGIVAIAIGSPSDPTDAGMFLNWRLSVALGLPMGGAIVLYTSYMYRRHRDFYARFFAATRSERRGALARRNVLLGLPVIGCILGLIIGGFSLGFAPFPAMMAMLVPFPLLIGEASKVRREAQVIWQRRAADQTLPAGPQLPGADATPGRRLSARRVVLWCLLGAAVAFAGYTMTLRQRERVDEARANLRDLLLHSVADHERFYQQTDLCRKASRICDPSKLAAAESSARGILNVANDYLHDWNYGNALHYGHLVLGRIALKKGDTREATRNLLQAGLTPGSPQLDDFGPDMTLARELLQQGQRNRVLRYFSLCNRFWTNRTRNCLTAWKDEVEIGQIPDFGSWAGPLPQPERGWTCELIEGSGLPGQ
jgi:hypothetical protein